MKLTHFSLIFLLFTSNKATKGCLNIIDVLLFDISGDLDQTSKHIEYLKSHHVIILICSKQMKDCIENKEKVEFTAKER